MTDRPNSVVITGASRGLGAALAVEYATQGVVLLLIGRNRDDLMTTAERARAKGAEVQIAAVDVTDRDAMAETLSAFDAAHPVDLVIANAGITAGVGPAGVEDRDASRRVLRTNLDGTLNTLDPVIPHMIARGAGQIAVISSIAALYPHPDQPTYSLTKAGLRAYITALAPVMAKRGLSLSVISMGFVDTDMAAGYRGSKPLTTTPTCAARHIRRGLAQGKRYISFPWPLLFLIRVNSLLPQVLRDRIMRFFRAEITGPP